MRRRTQRVNGLLQEEISYLLQRQVKDPRLGGLVTITGVATSPDFKYAKVFVSILGSEEEKRESFKGLSSARGFLRRELRERLSLRHIPELTFCKDDSLERGAHLLQLIKEVNAEGHPSESLIDEVDR